jgi:chromosome partitioning protein
MGELISPLILTRADYQEAARRGAGVTEFNPSGAAAQETRAVWQSIRGRLSRAKIQRPAREAA